jgi:hypothetical protein
MTRSEKHAQLVAGVANAQGMIAYDPVGAAAASGRSRSRIFLAIKNGELIARKDGRATVIEHDELVRWVRSMPTVSRPLAHVR